jgi:hypothetical protein
MLDPTSFGGTDFIAKRNVVSPSLIALALPHQLR